MSRNSVGCVTRRRLALSCLAGLLAFSRLARPQDPIQTLVSEPTSIHSVLRPPPRTPRNTGPELPIWHYQFVSPVSGSTYNGYMVGADPFRPRAGTLTIPVLLIPFVVQFTNTTTGFTTSFDPSAAPDAGCTAGQTALSLVENSPIFQNYPWTLNGVDMGVTQYLDVFQRANFWSYAQNANEYHTLLAYTVVSR